MRVFDQIAVIDNGDRIGALWVFSPACVLVVGEKKAKSGKIRIEHESEKRSRERTRMKMSRKLLNLLTLPTQRETCTIPDLRHHVGNSDFSQ